MKRVLSLFAVIMLLCGIIPMNLLAAEGVAQSQTAEADYTYSFTQLPGIQDWTAAEMEVYDQVAALKGISSGTPAELVNTHLKGDAKQAIKLTMSESPNRWTVAFSTCGNGDTSKASQLGGVFGEYDSLGALVRFDGIRIAVENEYGEQPDLTTWEKNTNTTVELRIVGADAGSWNNSRLPFIKCIQYAEKANGGSISEAEAVQYRDGYYYFDFESFESSWGGTFREQLEESTWNGNWKYTNLYLSFVNGGLNNSDYNGGAIYISDIQLYEKTVICDHIVVTDKGVEPTCTEKGLTEGKHCAVCGEVLLPQQVISPLGHEYKAEVTAPTCMQQGYTTYTCHCGDSYVADTVPARGHKYKGEVTPPTCLEQGYTTFVCDCGDTYTVYGAPAVGHIYKPNITAPTCEEYGYTTYVCHCGDSYVGNYLYPLGHKEVVDEGVEPTCTENGLTEGKHCDICGEVLVAQQTVEATGHTYDNASDTDCNECGAKRVKLSISNTVELGDLDQDGRITVADALSVLRIAAQLTAGTEDELRLGDIDGDGGLTVADALAILRIAAQQSIGV